MTEIYSKIHERYFDIVEDIITETETSTSMEELNQVMRRGLCRIKREEKVN